MSIPRENTQAECIALEHAPWSALTFPSIRLNLARLLVLVCFVWPFFNFRLVDPDGTMEVNFLPVMLAVLILPEVAVREKWSICLALPILLAALIFVSPVAMMRVAIGVIPLHFVLNLTRHLRERGEDLIPPDLAYRALQVFVAFSIVQTVEFRLIHVIPGWLTSALVVIVPRYIDVPAVDFGIRGVQGWASEPSSAAVTCSAFSLIAILNRPDRRWRVLALFAALTMVNKSIYSLLLLGLLALGCLSMLRRKRYLLFALVPMILAGGFLITRSSRVDDLRTNLVVEGMNSENSRELARFAQILYPLEQFPAIYKPKMMVLGVAAEPMGLLPLVVGYGSIFGVIWLAFILLRNFPRRSVPLRSFALIAGFVLFMIVAPDLIPSVVAFAAFMVPQKKQSNATLRAPLAVPGILPEAF